MADSIERALEAGLMDRFHIGQILVRKGNDGSFVLSHRGDETRTPLKTFRHAEDAVEIAKFDGAGNYRPLKTAPNLQHGWRLELATFDELKQALDYFYPGRLAIFAAWKTDELRWEIFAGSTADVCALFFGNGISKARLHRRDCHRKNLIRLLIKRWGRGRRPRLQFRCFARKRATCSWPNAAKW